jgi:hypothetical protein
VSLKRSLCSPRCDLQALDPLFADTCRLLGCAKELGGGLQILYSGKAHPADDPATRLLSPLRVEGIKAATRLVSVADTNHALIFEIEHLLRSAKNLTGL